MKLANANEMSIETLRTFSWTERLAHYDAYDMLNRPASSEISIWDETGHSQRYITQKTVSSDKGMVFEILQPCEVTPDNPPVVYITFVGAHSKETFLAAWQPSPGEETFRHHEEAVFLKHMNSVVELLKQRTQQKIDIVLIGHSLGGAYAQLGFHALQCAVMTHQCERADDSERVVFPLGQAYSRASIQSLSADNIASLTLGVWNAGGVIKPVADSSLLLAQSLAKLGVHQRAYYGLVEGDTLQTLGQGMILCGVEPPYAALHVLKINRRSEWLKKNSDQSLSYAATEANVGAPGMLASIYLELRQKADSHSNPTFHKTATQKSVKISAIDLPFQYADNLTPEGRAAIVRVLKRARLLNTRLFQSCRKHIYALLKVWVTKHQQL